MIKVIISICLDYQQNLYRKNIEKIWIFAIILTL